MREILLYRLFGTSSYSSGFQQCVSYHLLIKMVIISKERMGEHGKGGREADKTNTELNIS